MGKERGWGVFEGAESIFFRWFASKLRLGGCSKNCVLTRGSAPRPRTLHPIDGEEFHHVFLLFLHTKSTMNKCH